MGQVFAVNVMQPEEDPSATPASDAAVLEINSIRDSTSARSCSCSVEMLSVESDAARGWFSTGTTVCDRVGFAQQPGGP